MTEEPPVCPHNYGEYLKRGVSGVMNPIERGTLRGPTAYRQDIPEFHDCQRFAIYSGSSGKFDKMFAIFATERLPELGQLMPGLRAASSLYGSSLPVAEIIAEGPYKQLEIQAGFSCLYMFFDEKSSPAAWRAWIVWYGKFDQDCTTPQDPAAVAQMGKELKVKFSISPEGGPAVAEWEWGTGKEQYIGLGCAGGWCEIGGKGRESPSLSTKIHGFDDLTTDWKQVLRKGWYDRQVLAEKTSTGDASAPSQVIGTVVPQPGLETRDEKYFENGFQPVAWVLLEGTGSSSPSYAKLHLTAPRAGAVDQKGLVNPPSAGGAFNEVSLCKAVTADKCSGPAETVCSSAWRMRVVNTSGDPPYYFCVKYHDAKDAPGTARWHWRELDDVIWERCAEGCCELDA